MHTDHFQTVAGFVRRNTEQLLYDVSTDRVVDSSINYDSRGKKSCSSFHCKNEGRIMGGRVMEGRVCGRERKMDRENSRRFKERK